MGNVGAPLRRMGTNDFDTLDEDSVIFSNDPLSTMATPTTEQQTLLPRRWVMVIFHRGGH